MTGGNLVPMKQAEAVIENQSARKLKQRAEYNETDIGNSERFRSLFGGDIKHIHGIGWFVWDGRRWKQDVGNRKIRMMAHETAQGIFEEGSIAPEPIKRTRWAMQSGKKERISAMLCESEPYTSIEIEEMNTDPMLLNVKNGTVDLRTNELRPHEKADLITKLAPVEWQPDAKAPLFSAFLERVVPDIELREFISKFAGYSLTGYTSEQCLSFLQGLGANGKTTYIEIQKLIMGDYAATLPFASLLHRDGGQGGRATPDIARLLGVRMVNASEPDFGTRFSESIIKILTGGDTIAARFLHKDFFEFKPTFKLQIAGNHKPAIRGNDEGIWRRIRLIPFEQFIPEDERDGELIEKLWKESNGILNWMAEGCRQWQQDGLKEPKAVQEATQEYRDENDVLGEFFEGCIIIDPNGKVQAAKLYDAYTAHCESIGNHYPMTLTALGKELNERGFEKENCGVVFRKGLRLIDVLPSTVQSIISLKQQRVT